MFFPYSDSPELRRVAKAQEVLSDVSGSICPGAQILNGRHSSDVLFRYHSLYTYPIWVNITLPNLDLRTGNVKITFNVFHLLAKYGSAFLIPRSLIFSF